MNATAEISVENRAMIPLGQLYLSPTNMRKNPASYQANDGLKESIRASGIIQNLVVTQTESGFAVEAGGRRLQAANELKDEGVFTEETPVPCLILAEGQNANDISLTENFMRASANPVDEFRAFAKLAETEPLEDIAQRYGKTRTYVAQRLRLAEIHPEILESYLSGDVENFTFACLEAFTVNPDKDLQLNVFNEYKDHYGFNPVQIKRCLRQESLKADSKLVKFVGLDAYKAANGPIAEDLFSDEIYIEDSGLITRLAQEKIDSIAENLRKEWRWVEIDWDNNFDVWKLASIPSTKAELSDELKSELARLEDQSDKLDENWDESLEAEAEAIEFRIGEINAIEEDLPYRYETAHKAFAGCVIKLNYRGELDIRKGLLAKEDAKKFEQFLSPSNGKADSEDLAGSNDLQTVKPAAHSNALSQDLSEYKKVIVQNAVANNAEIGIDLLLYCALFNSGYSRISGLSMTTDHFNPSVSSEALTDVAKEVNTGNKGYAGSFDEFRKLSDDEKHSLAAKAIAATLPCEKKLTDYLLTETQTNVAAAFRPTSATYFNRIKRDQLDAIATELIGKSWVEDNKKLKKSEIADILESTVAGEPPIDEPATPVDELKAWLPQGF